MHRLLSSWTNTGGGPYATPAEAPLLLWQAGVSTGAELTLAPKDSSVVACGSDMTAPATRSKSRQRPGRATRCRSACICIATPLLAPNPVRSKFARLLLPPSSGRHDRRDRTSASRQNESPARTRPARLHGRRLDRADRGRRASALPIGHPCCCLDRRRRRDRRSWPEAATVSTPTLPSHATAPGQNRPRACGHAGLVHACGGDRADRRKRGRALTVENRPNA
jgi:hypothetical protein